MQITYMRVQQTIALARLQMKLETAPKGCLIYHHSKSRHCKSRSLIKMGDSKGSNNILGINGTLSFTTSLLWGVRDQKSR